MELMVLGIKVLQVSYVEVTRALLDSNYNIQSATLLLLRKWFKNFTPEEDGPAKAYRFLQTGLQESQVKMMVNVFEPSVEYGSPHINLKSKYKNPMDYKNRSTFH